MSQRAHITGDVQYREGDGANSTIPLGPCEVHQTELDATISWTEGESPGSAAIPIADFHLLPGDTPHKEAIAPSVSTPRRCLKGSIC